MSTDDRLYLDHMRDHAAKALALAAGKTRAAFDADEVLRLALTYLIQIIGEAASQVSQETKDAHPENALAEHRRHAASHCPRLFSGRRRHRLEDTDD